MPLLSVIVPVYLVEGYLRQCLDSILDQTFTDFELIIVNDHSPDSSREILAEYAARDGRVTVIELDRNVGLGQARNVGLDQAAGEYVWFVDSDDWLAEGAMFAVASRIRTTEPDVLIVDHAKVSWTGQVSARSGRYVSDRPLGAEVFTLAERPEATRLLHTAWNKVIRREFLVDLGLRFGSGWYEDVSFTFPILVAAQRITRLERVCMYYRQRRHGAITRTVSERHVEAFDHWRRVFGLLEEWRVGDEVRRLLFDRMVWHYLIILGHAGRVPKHQRPEFFERISSEYRRLKPPGYREPPGIQGLRYQLVARNAYRAFELMRAGNRARGRSFVLGRRVLRRGRSLSQRFARRSRTALQRLYYRAQMLRRLDEPLAVYSAYWGRGYACNPAAIYEKARELAPGIRGVWVVRPSHVHTLPPGTEYVILDSWRYYRTLARAKWFINNVNYPDFAKKRPDSVHVMTHHGTPLKVMGVDQQAYPVGARGKDIVAEMQRADRWDFSITANTFTTQMWARAYPTSYETLEVGYPRNDRLATADQADALAARRRLEIAPGRIVALWAPTFREYAPGYRPLGEPELLAEAIDPDSLLLVRSHYFDGCTGSVTDQERVRDVSDYPTVEDLYLAADVLITDYSSAMFDYAVLDRPIVIYAPDWEAYRLTRGVYFDLMAEPPGVVARSLADLLDVFRTGAYQDDAANKARAQFRRRFCHRDDGRAAERVVRRVFLGESTPA